jgi:predicted nucleotidyltransferase
MELISYAVDFVSYLLQNIKEKDLANIKSIILFGSVARGEAGAESDVDVFVDSLDEKIEKNVLNLRDKFYGSSKFKKYWGLFGVKNEINVIVGKLDKWKLRDSMLGSSIILYQKYAPKLEEGKNKVVLYWGNVKPNSKRVMLNKKISGYNYYGRIYKGLLEKYNGVKIGSNVIVVDAEFLKLFLDAFHGFKVAVKMIRVFEYS